MSPKGMGDLLPPTAEDQRALTRELLSGLGRAGYDLVMPPLFEHAHVVELGNNAVDRRDLLRFVEAQSGEVAVLRPDITPQIARIVATHLAGRPAPWRLCYEGRVLRRRRGRARSHLQMSQVGVECVGIQSPQGDVEVLTLAMDGCRDVGLDNFLVELGEAGLARTVLDKVPEAARPAIAELVRRKDAAALNVACREAGLSRGVRVQLEALLAHYGGIEVLSSARAAFKGRAAQAALDNLEAISTRLVGLGYAKHVAIDLAETRGLGYYTGLRFSLLADGPGEAICSGGRYDNLLGRFGSPQPAAGFALELENLQWALRAAGTPYAAPQPPRLVLSGGSEHAREQTARELRARGLTAVGLPDGKRSTCLAFARAWGYDGVLWQRAGETRVQRAVDEQIRVIQWPKVAAAGEFTRWLRSKKG